MSLSHSVTAHRAPDHLGFPTPHGPFLTCRTWGGQGSVFGPLVPGLGFTHHLWTKTRAHPSLAQTCSWAHTHWLLDVTAQSAGSHLQPGTQREAPGLSRPAHPPHPSHLHTLRGSACPSLPLHPRLRGPCSLRPVVIISWFSKNVHYALHASSGFTNLSK